MSDVRFVVALLLLVTATPALADADVAGLRHRDAIERARAAAAVAARGLRRTIPRLMALLEDDHVAVRLAAVKALRRLRARSAAMRLLVKAQIDPDPRVREAAAEAVLKLDPQSFAAKLGTADPPPVAPPPLPPLRPRARYATLFTLGVAANARRIDESVSGTAGFALRWGPIETQLELGFPSMSLGLRARWLIISYPRFTPYLTAGGVVAFNNGSDVQQQAVAVLGGAGLRWYIIPPIFLQAEVWASYAVHAPTAVPRRGERFDVVRFSLPVLLSAGLELWP